MTDNLVIRYGLVVSTEDNLDGNRIKVRIENIDNMKGNDDLPYAFPFMPKTFLSYPKKGESVIVLINLKDINGDRFYLGPIISQTDKIDYDPYLPTALCLFKNSVVKPDTPANNNIATKGLYPVEGDIAIQGRYNSDIIFKENELRIRCGQDNGNKEFNELHSFIQLKNDIKNESDFNSAISLVSDTIFLLSHKNPKKFNTNNNEGLITNEEYDRIFENAYSLPYGEVLVDILSKLISVFSNHTHPYDGMVLTPTPEVESFKKINLDNMLSKNIKIN